MPFTETYLLNSMKRNKIEELIDFSFQDLSFFTNPSRYDRHWRAI